MPEQDAEEQIESPELLFLKRRQQAYQRVFNPENLFLKDVMADLARFCRATDSCFHLDPRAHAALEGRREVYLRIQDHLKLNPDEMLAKYGSGQGVTRNE